MSPLRMFQLVSVVAAALARQDPVDPLALPAGPLPACTAIPSADLPSPAAGANPRRFNIARGYELHWMRGLGGGGRVRILRDSSHGSWLLIAMASPSLPSSAMPEIVSATIDASDRVSGVRTTLPREPAELARRQRALAQGDTAALRAADARHNAPLRAEDHERVRVLLRWMQARCAAAP